MDIRLSSNARSCTRVHEHGLDTSESTRDNGYLSETSSCSKTTRTQAESISYDLTLLNSFRRLVLARVNLVPILIKWPECVPEQTSRIIFLLERNKTLPIFAKGGSHTCWGLVPSKELRIASLHLRTLTLHHEKLPYRGKGPTTRHRLDSISEPLCHRWRGKENSVISGGRGEVEKILRLRR